MKKILPKEEEKEFFIQKNFDEIANYYDKFNDLFTFGMHKYWKRTLINMVDIHNAKKAIDLCCGSGDLAILMTDPKYHNPDLRIIACDFSEGMLSVMKKRIQNTPIQNYIEIRKENVLSLPRDFENTFHIATVGYGIRNVKDRKALFREAFRILTIGGRLGILEVGTIEPRWLRPFAHFFMKNIIPLIGYLIQGKKHQMYQYLPVSALHFPPPSQIVQELYSTGFQKVITKKLFFGASIIYVAYK